MTQDNGQSDNRDPPNLSLLIKLLRMTTSANDAEALTAMRKANDQLAKFGGDWDRLLRGQVTIVADPFGDIPDARPANRESPPPPPSFRQPPSPQAQAQANAAAQAAAQTAATAAYAAGQAKANAHAAAYGANRTAPLGGQWGQTPPRAQRPTPAQAPRNATPYHYRPKAPKPKIPTPDLKDLGI